MNENFNLALIISPCKNRFGIVIKFAVSKITMNKNWRSKQDSKSIEISAWDYKRWKSEGEGKWRSLTGLVCQSTRFQWLMRTMRGSSY